MDLGIKGKWAIVCGASKGLGYGCARALAEEGVNLVVNARGADVLEAAAGQIRKETGVQVVAVAGSVVEPGVRQALIDAAPQIDILVNNAGGPPPGNFRQFKREDWIAALDANMLAPIELIRATVDGMIERRFGRIVNITSSAVKAPIEILGLSNGARSGLTGFVAGLARTTVKDNVTINNLLPGRFMTDRLRGNLAAEAKKRAISEEQAAAAALTLIPAGRFGEASEFGQYCAYLCSRQAAYITGQNLLIDGGGYPGTF